MVIFKASVTNMVIARTNPQILLFEVKATPNTIHNIMSGTLLGRWHCMPYLRSKKKCIFNTIPCRIENARFLGAKIWRTMPPS